MNLEVEGVDFDQLLHNDGKRKSGEGARIGGYGFRAAYRRD